MACREKSLTTYNRILCSHKKIPQWKFSGKTIQTIVGKYKYLLEIIKVK